MDIIKKIDDVLKQQAEGRKIQYSETSKEGTSEPREKREHNAGGRKRFHKNKSFKMDEKKQKICHVGKRLSEVDIGITEYISDYEGFSGIVKDRFSDFHVNEISIDGIVAKLTTFEIPDLNKQTLTTEELEKTIPEDILTQLTECLHGNISKVEIDVTELDKNIRKNIHQISKSIPNIISHTVDKDNKKILIVAKKDASNKLFGSRQREHMRVRWSECEGEYLHFILHKVNKDTMDALNILASELRTNVSLFRYAGTKDRRAKTSQWISIKKGNPYIIEKASKKLRGVYIGNFKFSKKSLQLGVLKGNQFTIALRNVTVDDNFLDVIMNSLKNNGFINYFGLQRFGSIASIPTYEIGKMLLQENWTEAVDLILKPREEEQDKNLANARIIYKNTQNAKEAFKKIKRVDKIEAKLLRGIDICGKKNLQGALNHIPKFTMLMYIHSYQSLVWNKIVSKRIKEFGKKPIVGDLVYLNSSTEEVEHIIEDDNEESNLNEQIKENTEEMQVDNENSNNIEDMEDVEEKLEKNEIENEEVKQNNNTCISSGENDNGKNEDNERETEIASKQEIVGEVSVIEEKSIKNDNVLVDTNDINVNQDKETDKNLNKNYIDKKIPEVKILTEEDLPNYTLEDIVMPLPGYKVTYPPYAKPWYDEILEKDGLNTDLKTKNKQYTLPGFYRSIIKKPIDLSWKITHYENRNEDLILSDIDEMKKIELPKENPDAKYKALIIKMSLPSSTYATTALREILKQDMSSQTQAANSAAHV